MMRPRNTPNTPCSSIPQQIEAHWILARVFALQQRWGDLEQILATAEKDVPDDLRPFYEAAQALLEIGKEFPRAEGYAKKYLSQEPEGEEPDNAEAHRLLGLVFEKEGRNAEARAEIHNRPPAPAQLQSCEGRFEEIGELIGRRASCRFPSPNQVNQKQRHRAASNDCQRDAVHSAHEADQPAPATPKQKTHVTDDQCPANRTRETKKQKDRERHAQNAGQNSRKYAQARDETCRKDCPLTMLEKYLLGIIVPLCEAGGNAPEND